MRLKRSEGVRMSRRYRALSAFAGLALSACAAQPAPPVRYSGSSESLAAREAREIAAARQHPNAQPRPRPLYPEQAPPPLAADAKLPPPMYVTRRSAPYPNYPASSSVLVEREIYPYSSYSYRPRYGFGLSYGYSYPYAWGPYGYDYYPSRYRYGYGLGFGVGLGAHYGYRGGYGHSHGFHLGAPRYHSGFGRGHSLHIRSVGGGFHHRH